MEAFDQREMALADLSWEIGERIRTGEEVSIQDYVERYPDLAGDVGWIVMTSAALRQASTRKKLLTKGSVSKTYLDRTR